MALNSWQEHEFVLQYCLGSYYQDLAKPFYANPPQQPDDEQDYGSGSWRTKDTVQLRYPNNGFGYVIRVDGEAITIARRHELDYFAALNNHIKTPLSDPKVSLKIQDYLKRSLK